MGAVPAARPLAWAAVLAVLACAAPRALAANRTLLAAPRTVGPLDPLGPFSSFADFEAAMAPFAPKPEAAAGCGATPAAACPVSGLPALHGLHLSAATQASHHSTVG